MTTMRRQRTSAIAIGLAMVLLVASCGSEDSDAEADAMTASSVDEPSTTGGSTTTTTTTTTTPPPPSTTAPPTTAPPTAAPTTEAPVALVYCDGAGPLPATAVLDSSLTLDVMDDGTADDLVEAYDVDGWSRLRLTTGGSVVSEIINPAIDGRYRPLGVAPVFPGDSAELFAVIGEGSAATDVGVFGTDDTGCLFSYTYQDTTDDFTMLIRPASPSRSGAFCFDGGIGLITAERRSDGLWDASSSAFEVATPKSVQYLGASDDYSEGLAETDLSPFEFDCFGLAI